MQDVFCSNLSYIQKCTISEHMFTRKYEHTKIGWLVSEIMIHTKMCNVWEFLTNMRFVLSEQMLLTKMCNVRTYVTHDYEIFSLNLCYTRKCNMSEPMLHTKIWCLVFALKSHMKMWIVHCSYTFLEFRPRHSLDFSESGPRRSLDWW